MKATPKAIPKEKLITARVSSSLDADIKKNGIGVSETVRESLAWAVSKKRFWRDLFEVKVLYRPAKIEDPYWQEEYSVSAVITWAAAGLHKADIIFLLPEIIDIFKGTETARIYSLSDYKEIFPGCRSQKNGRLIGAKLVDGKWAGHVVLLDPTQVTNSDEILEEVREQIENNVRAATLEALEIQAREVNINAEGEILHGTFRRYRNSLITISKPDNYQLGAWRLEIELTDAAKENNEIFGDDFIIPKLPNRLIHVDGQYSRAAKNKVTGEYEIMMRFVDGVVKAHVYTNGIAEEENLTSLEEVCDAISESITKSTGI